MVYIANGRYKLVRRLGGGAFGEVFVAESTAISPEQSPERYAVKLEPIKSQHHPHLHHEARLYAYMSRNTTTVGIPKIRWFGTEGDYSVLVMELLGPSLEEVFEFCKQRFTIKTVLMLADQMIARLQFIHGLSYLHRDIKPENFVMGLHKKAHHLYIIDFGLAKRYADWRTGKHIPYIDGKALTGTARYVSINTHLGVQQARRDDMEGIAYVLIYLAQGGLPWQGIRCATKAEKYDKIKTMKLNRKTSELCGALPSCFERYLIYTRQLAFEDSPDYDYCRGLFAEQMRAQGDLCDYDYCWLKSKHTSASSSVVPTTSDIMEQSGVATSASGLPSMASEASTVHSPSRASSFHFARRPPNRDTPYAKHQSDPDVVDEAM